MVISTLVENRNIETKMKLKVMKSLSLRNYGKCINRISIVYCVVMDGVVCKTTSSKTRHELKKTVFTKC